MKSKSKSVVYEVKGIDEGEHLTLMALSADEFTLTVVEPNSYGDDRKAASMALSRLQMRLLVHSATWILSDAAEEGHNDR